MLVRAWSPVLRWAAARPRTVAVMGPAALAALACIPGARRAPTRDELIGVGAAAALAALIARRAGPALAACAAMAAAHIAAAACGASSTLAAPLAGALALPTVDELRRAHARDNVAAAGVRALGLATIAAQPVALGLLLAAPASAAGVAVGALAAVILATAWRRPHATAAAWRELQPAERGGDAIDVGVALIVLGGGVVTGAIGTPVIADDRGEVVGVALAMLGLWLIVTGRPSRVIAAALAMAGALGWLALGTSAWSGRELAAAIAVAQAPALALTLAPRSRFAPIAQLVAIGAAGGVADWLEPALVAGAAACLAQAAVPAPCRARAGSTPLARVARALRRLEPFWFFYGHAKLARDPIYAALAAAPERWGRVLDVGCGPGLAAAIAVARGDATSYLGVDLDEDKLRNARTLLASLGQPLDSGWRLAQAALPAALPRAAPCDTALLLDVLHYWPLEKQHALVALVAAALAPGGALWLRESVVDDAGSGRVARGERFTTRFGLNPPNPVRFVERAQLETLLRACGFAIESCEPCGAGNRLWRCRRVASGSATA